MIAHRLDDRVFVSGQIMPGDMAEIAALGVTTIVNNRPDGEEPGQPSGDEIADAAEAAGLAYREVPVSGGIEPEQIEDDGGGDGRRRRPAAALLPLGHALGLSLGARAARQRPLRRRGDRPRRCGGLRPAGRSAGCCPS